MTKEQRQEIEAMRDGAANHGDRETQDLCPAALDVDPEATEKVLDLLKDDPQADFE